MIRDTHSAPFDLVFNTVVPGLGLALLLGAAMVPAIAVAAAAALAITAAFALRRS